MVNRSVARVFRDSSRTCESGPSRVITAAVVRGLKPQGFRRDVEASLKLRVNQKENPGALLGAARDAAITWRVVGRHEADSSDREISATCGQGSPLPHAHPAETAAIARQAHLLDVW